MLFPTGIRASNSLLAACGGDTVKLFDVNIDSGDPCVLAYTPSPGSHVNSIKWNHTNLVVASAGDNKKISFWRTTGQNIGELPMSNDVAGTINGSISAINFSNKGCRYFCTGGSGRVIRIWDLQRKLCIKKLVGHSDTITGAMYNLRDEHLASISLKGDLIVHNLSSGMRAADLKDPKGQVLRELDYSRFSRHLLVTAGDDGSLHLWDITGRSPKSSWLNQHSAPTTGVCFSPSSDKIIASVGLDKKLYTYDSSSKRATFCAPYDAPFSSLVFEDDGNILSAATNSGQVVFYDVRGKSQPFTLLQAYDSSQSITGLCWQRSKPLIVNETDCSSEAALVGDCSEDTVIMPDPLPSATELISSTLKETPLRKSLLAKGYLSNLETPIRNSNMKDGMDIFSPVVEVQPISPSLQNLWDGLNEAKTEGMKGDKKPAFPSPSSQTYLSRLRTPANSSDMKDDMDVFSPLVDVQPISPSLGNFSDGPIETENDSKKPTFSHLSSRRHLYAEANIGSPHTADMKPALRSTQDETYDLSRSAVSPLPSPRSNMFVDTLNNHRIRTGSLLLRSIPPESEFQQPKISLAQANPEFPISSSTTQRYATYAERISSRLFSNAPSSPINSPKSKKTGLETREELTGMLPKQNSTLGVRTSPSENIQEPKVEDTSPNHPQGTSPFLLQLVHHTIEETMSFIQQSIHNDVHNLHVELLRQFHTQEMEMSNLVNPILEKLEELTTQVMILRRENQQLRQLL